MVPESCGGSCARVVGGTGGDGVASRGIIIWVLRALVAARQPLLEAEPLLESHMRKRVEDEGAPSIDVDGSPGSARSRAPRQPLSHNITGLSIALVVLTVLVIISRKTAKPAAKHPKSWRPTARLVQALMDNEPTPSGMTRKQFMYDCFKRDVARGRLENPSIPDHRGLISSTTTAENWRLRVVSFNVHFFRVGYSDQMLADSFEEVTTVLSHLHADVCLLQEVPASLVAVTKRRMQTLGYAYSVSAGSGDAHVLPAEFTSFPAERLHVMILSKLPFGRHEAVPMGDGHAAFAELQLQLPTSEPGQMVREASLLMFSLHLSVCSHAIVVV